MQAAFGLLKRRVSAAVPLKASEIADMEGALPSGSARAGLENLRSVPISITAVWQRYLFGVVQYRFIDVAFGGLGQKHSGKFIGRFLHFSRLALKRGVSRREQVQNQFFPAEVVRVRTTAPQEWNLEMAAFDTHACRRRVDNLGNFCCWFFLSSQRSNGFDCCGREDAFGHFKR